MTVSTCNHDSTHPSEWGYYKPRGIAALFISAIHHHIYTYILRGIIRALMRKAIVHWSSIYDIEFYDLKFRCHVDDNHTERGIVTKGPRHKREGIEKIVNILVPGSTFVDVGANSGLYTTLAARRVGSSGKVIAIEPMPEMISRLRFNIAANGFDNIEVFETAVGDMIGTTDFYVHRYQHGQSTLSQHPQYEREVVPITRLSTIVKHSGLTKIDALKIDIEGHEDRVLIPFIADAPKSLWPKRIFMETAWSSRWEKDCIQHLLDAGYRMAWHGKKDVLLALDNIQ